MLGTLLGPFVSVKNNAGSFGGEFILVFDTAMSRVPPESNSMGNRINPLLGPPPFLVSDTVQCPVMS